MDYFEIGMRFPSYKTLMESMEEFCQQTQSKFWKRDARTISASRSSGGHRFLNPDIIYYEIKFTCIYGGMYFKSKGKNLRNRVPSLKTNGCPAYLRFKASEDGDALQLVAINLNHNHELKVPKRKNSKRKEVESTVLKQKKRLRLLEQMDSVEIEQQSSLATDDENEDLESTSEVVDYIKVQYEDIKTDPVSDKLIKTLQVCFQHLISLDISSRQQTDHLNSACTATFNFSGLIAPVFTPFNDDLCRSLNLEVIPTYAQYLAEAGISGVLVNGTTGEGPSMTVEERKVVTDVWAQVCVQTGQHLMVQIGGAALPDVIEMAQHAEHKGVNSLLCLPELYIKPKTSSELIHYLQIVGQAAPNTPLLYYHIPSFTNVNIHMGTFLNEASDKIPTFRGIKFTSTVLDEGVAAVKAYSGKFSVFLGADTVLAGACTLGFDSAIATTLNIFPELGQRILHHIKEGNISEAQSAQEELNAAIEVITRNGTWVSSMKEAMNILTPINPGPVREPHTSLVPKQVKQMETELKSLSFIQS